MKKITAIAVFVLIISLFASACGGSASSAPAASQPASPGQDKPGAGAAEPASEDPGALHMIRVPFDERTTVDLCWGWNLFDRDASEYSHDLAMAAIVMSQAAEMGYTACEERYGQLGFGHQEHYWYGGNEDNVNMPAFVMASQRVTVGGQDKVLVSISVRGTTDTGDWITDAFSQLDGFLRPAEGVNDYFRSYYDGLSEYYGVPLTSENTVFFITGHSLGGAVACLLGKMTEDIGYRGNIFVYTFAAPHCQTEGNVQQYGNMHHIINTYDLVPYLPFGYTRYGHEWYYSRDRGNPVQNHILETYLKCMLQGVPSNIGSGADSSYDQDSVHYGEDTDVSLVGTWQSVGSTGFGQAQPGAIIRFDADTCNFYSPNDSYVLYESEGQVYLECTSYIFAETLTFRVDASDPNLVLITYGGTVTTLQRVDPSGGQPADGGQNGGTSWGDDQPADGGQSDQPDSGNGGAYSGDRVPSGQYYSTDGFNQVFTFHDDGTITMSAFGISADGTYTIGNGTITIRYNFLGDQVWSPSFSMSGNSVWIAGTEFVRR
ncbi:MAG: lipase family protein [Lachnospiraceae bacterium]|nr:lipase family protein [Lachnospiraceae bacterium]